MKSPSGEPQQGKKHDVFTYHMLGRYKMRHIVAPYAILNHRFATPIRNSLFFLLVALLSLSWHVPYPCVIILFLIYWLYS